MAKPIQPNLIGVLHLLPLPGSPECVGLSAMDLFYRAGERAIDEAKKLERAGFEGLILENFGDRPFVKGPILPETLSAMTLVAAAVREVVKVPLGINVLRNDGVSALAIASLVGADFVRINVLSGVVATDQGMIEGCAAEVVKKRQELATPIQIWADVFVKHAVTLSSQSIGAATADVISRSCADAVIVTGEATGTPASLEWIEMARKAAQKYKTPLYLGSGMDPENLETYLPHSKRAIVGSTLRKGGMAGADLDMKRVNQFVTAYRKLTKRVK